MLLSENVMVNCTVNTAGTHLLFENDRGQSLLVAKVSTQADQWGISYRKHRITHVENGIIAKQLAHYLLRRPVELDLHQMRAISIAYIKKYYRSSSPG